MNAPTLKALKLSIAHWLRLSTGKRRKEEGITADQCALCKLFFQQHDRCKGCPVRKKTGRIGCSGSPYDLVYANSNNLDSPQFKAAAKLELEFLRSLLPKKRKQPTKAKPCTKST